jgi:aspartate-semialdehyde dehydrogenase
VCGRTAQEHKKDLAAARPYRIAIVGAASLLGKELTEALADSPLAASDIVLLDAEDAAGRLSSSGEEVNLIQKLDADALSGLDIVFFAGDPETARTYYVIAGQANASVVDLTYALEGEPEAILRGLWGGLVPQTAQPDLTTPVVTSAHPAALMLSLLTRRLRHRLPIRTVMATFFEPASEHGQAAMDELHQQTVSLLSFQSLPRERYDAQIAFNMLPSLGDAGKVKLSAIRQRILNHYGRIAGAEAVPLDVQLIQAPVFHAYTAIVFVELDQPATLATFEAAVQGDRIDLVGAESDPPSNLSAAGQPDLLLQVRSAGETDGGTRFALWMAADNLKVSAANAIACANELRRVRPQGSIQ